MRQTVLAFVLAGLAVSPAAQPSRTVTATASATTTVTATRTLYEQNFEQAEPGSVPAEFLVLEGGFAVKAEGGNKFLELPGAPLETFGLLFGPSEQAGVSASARFQGTAKGRRYPTFGVGLNGVSGPRLQVSPGRKALELYKSDELLAGVPFEWEPGAWLWLRVAVRPVKEGLWQVTGKAWKDGQPEPAAWTISHDETTPPLSGRASIWGAPFSGTPIHFDDLRVTATGP